MYSLIYCLSFFFFAFIFHLIFWRFYFPKKQIRTLLLIFCCSLFCGLFFVEYYQIGPTLYLENLFVEYLRISLLFIAMTLTYCVVYLSLIDDSPSLFTVMSIYNAGDKGISKKELGCLITDEIFIKPRLEYLVEEKFIFKSGNIYLLAPKGRKLFNIFIFVRKLMKMPSKPG